MNPRLNHTMSQHPTAELRGARERARLVTEAPARGRRLPDQNTIARPTAAPRRAGTALEIERAIGGAR
jgi:hypothetical protein